MNLKKAAAILIVIAIIAFLLGITVTIFCFYLKKWQEEKEQEKKRM